MPGTRWLQLARLASIAAAITGACARATPPTWAGGLDNRASNAANWLNLSNLLAPGKSDHVVISSGTVVFDADAEYGALDFSGGALNGTSTLSLGTIADSTWTGGAMTFSSGGGLRVSTGAKWSIAGTSDHDFAATTLTNNGTVNWSGGRLRSGSGGVFTNNATFNDSASSEVNSGLGGAALVFNNAAAGQYNKSAAGTTTFQVAFNNSGAVAVTAGRLLLSGGGTSGGTLSATGSGADLVVDNGYTFSSGSTLTGAVRLTGGTFTASGDILANGLTIEGGNLSGTHTLKSGTVTWTGGTWNETGGSTTIDATGTLTMGGAGDHDFNGRAIANNGTVNWSGGNLRSGSGGRFTNNATFNDSASGTVNNNYGGSALVFTNAASGTYNKTGTGETRFQIAFDNQGVVNVNTGTLTLEAGGTLASGARINTVTGSQVTFSNGFTLQDQAQLNGNGAFTLSGGTLTANGNISVSTLEVTGGRVAGSHTLTGQIKWTGGDFNDSSATTIASGSTLTVSGAVDHDFNGHAFTNNGTLAWNGGNLRSGNNGSLTNKATFNDGASGEVNAAYGGTSTFTNASGATYNKTAAGQTTFNVPLDNQGTMNVQAGTLKIAAGGTLAASGRLNADAGTTVEFGNNYTLASGSVLNGTGAYRVSAGQLTALGNITAANFTLAGGRLADTHRFLGNVTWSGGDLNTAGTTGIAAGGSLTISGAIDHDFNGRTIVNDGVTTWGAGSLRTGNGGQFTNNGTFVDNASGSINADYGSGAQFTNAAGATYRKAAAGQTTIVTTFVNSGTLDVQSGTLSLQGGTTFNSGTTSTGSGLLKLDGGTLTANGSMSFAKFQIAGGSVSGSHTFGGAVQWSAGNFNNTGSTAVSGTLTIDGTGDHDFDAHTFSNSGTVTWAAGAGRLRSGNGGQFQNQGVFNDEASGTWNNDYQNTAAKFSNGATASYNKKSAGTTTFNAVEFVNAGTINVTAGSLDLQGGGSSPVGAHFNVGAGSFLRFTGGNFGIADGAGLSGTGSFVVAGGKTTIGTTVSVADFQLIGGTLGGTQSFTGGFTWSGGNLNEAGSVTTIGAGGKLTISTNADHDFDGHGLVNNGTVDWQAGRLRSGNGGSITNAGVFNDNAGATVNNDYQNATLTFSNAAGGVYNKGGAATSTFAVPFHNAGTVNVTTGDLDLTSGGTIASGAAFRGAGRVLLSGGTFTFNGGVTTENLELAGSTLAGNPEVHGVLKFASGLLGSGGTTTIASDGVLQLNSSGDHDLPGHAIVNNGVINWNGGRIRGGNGSTIVNNGTFNDLAGVEVNNDYQNTVLTFTNSAGGTYHKSGAGTTTVAIPFVNRGKLYVSGGTIIFSGTFTNQGSVGFANGAVAKFSAPLTFSTATLGGTGTLQAPSVTAGGLVSPGNSPGTLTITGDFSLLGTSTLLIELGGTTQGSGYDYLNVGGNVVLGGTLNLSLVNGFGSTVLASDTFTILSSGGTGGLSGSFLNVGTGQRLTTLDGLGSFQVNYGAGLNGVTLTNFQAIPEPSTYALLGLGLLTLAVAARRRRSER